MLPLEIDERFWIVWLEFLWLKILIKIFFHEKIAQNVFLVHFV